MHKFMQLSSLVMVLVTLVIYVVYHDQPDLILSVFFMVCSVYWTIIE